MGKLHNTMNNFIGTEYESFTEEEVFMDNQKLISATIKRKFPNYASYCKMHMLDYDDLISLGNEGLLKAIRTFDSNSPASFTSHAINHINWNIKTQAKNESLRTINTQSNQVADIISVEHETNNEEGITVLDTLECDECVEDVVEDKVFISDLTNFLSTDKDVDERLLHIIIGRAIGKTLDQIASELGVGRTSIIEKLKTNKAKRVKSRLLEYLKDGTVRYV